MNKIIDIDESNFIATVQPGVVVGDLQNKVEKKGLFYPPDPSNLKVSTIGGSIALSSSGPRFFKYGGTKDYVIDLEVITPEGNIINTGSKTVKSSLGYNLTQLFIGSEGTLGIITEAKLKLIPKPENTRLIVAFFNSIEKASRVVSSIIQEKITPSTIDLIDNLTINAIEKFNPSNLATKAEAALYIEVDGYDEIINKHISQIENICKNYGVLELKISQNNEELENLWTSRRSAFSAVSRLKPNVVSEDIVVSKDKITDAIYQLQEITKKYNLMISIIGHIGDGNIHPNFLVDLRDEKEAKSLQLALNEVFSLVETYNGALSGEHGIGLVKAGMLKNNNYLKIIKNAFDPNNILNPNKVIK